MSLSLRAKVVILVITLIIFLTTTLSFLTGLRASADLKTEIGISLTDTAYQMTSRLDQYMWGRAGEIRMLSELALLKNPTNLGEVEILLNKMKENYPAFAWIGLTNVEGVVLAGTDGILVGQSIAKRPVYLQGMKGEFIGDVHDAVLLAKLLPNPTGEPMKFVDISLPIKDKDNNSIGVLAAHLSWSWAGQIEESMFKALRDRNKEEIFIVSRLDNTILLGPKAMLGEKLELESIKRAQSGEIGWREESWPDGEKYLTGFASGEGYLDFKGLEWIVLVRQPIEVAYGIVYHLQLFIWLIGGVFSVLFAMVGWGMAGSITKPLTEFTKAADRIRFGGRVEISKYKGIKEVELLTESLTELVNSLSAAETELTKMEAIAHHDRLTGLPNRIGLDHFTMTVSKVAKEQNDVIAVLYMDLDGFKNVNDTMGHLAGDLVLKTVARRLKNTVRAGEFVARLGGDEFIAMIFVEKDQQEEIAGNIATRIIQEINKPIIVEGEKVKVGCSIGCAFWLGGDDIQTVINLADQALYEVKRTGKNRFQFIKD